MRSNLDATVLTTMLPTFVYMHADANMQVRKQMLHVKRYVLEHMTAHETEVTFFPMFQD